MDQQTLLLVDDEPRNLQLLRQILKADYQLLFAKSGQEALERAFEQRPDLILLDVMMPDLDGYTVCAQLKQDARTRHIPVIFVTAMSEESDEARGFELGAVDYIAKPVRAPVVRARVRNHLTLVDQHRACAKEVTKRTEELMETRLASLQMLGKAAEYKDNETGLHVIRMSNFAALLAEKYGWNSDDCGLMLHASAMHDIGKIGIPDRILLKPGKLDDAEWGVMRKHPGIGAGIIGRYSGQSRLFDMARQIALTHHEKWDGSGYPRGLAGEEIPISGRMVAIADVFDALTTRRPYKDPWPIEKTVETLKKDAGTHFDPRLVDLFIENLEGILAIKARWEETPVAERMEQRR
ncbi:HD domain-containing phosphohydrolase [Magnetococcus sp. PR-3]|uniref:HD domain-containing phosphohydrolase n=1 Tax=Magnetococcus sp. PR-3 TaxID=3120355 RepID=UPI002FCE491B